MNFVVKYERWGLKGLGDPWRSLEFVQVHLLHMYFCPKLH